MRIIDTIPRRNEQNAVLKLKIWNATVRSKRFASYFTSGRVRFRATRAESGAVVPMGRAGCERPAEAPTAPRYQNNDDHRVVGCTMSAPRKTFAALRCTRVVRSHAAAAWARGTASRRAKYSAPPRVQISACPPPRNTGRSDRIQRARCREPWARPASARGQRRIRDKRLYRARSRSI
jgi:hypothetical protein